MSEGLLPFLGPVLELSTDLGQDCHIYLLEDGLELWLTLLHNTAKPYDTLIRLLPRIPPLLQLGSENLRTTIYILQVIQKSHCDECFFCRLWNDLYYFSLS